MANMTYWSSVYLSDSRFKQGGVEVESLCIKYDKVYSMREWWKELSNPFQFRSIQSIRI